MSKKARTQKRVEQESVSPTKWAYLGLQYVLAIFDFYNKHKHLL